MAPRPKTATLAPGSTAVVLRTAPMPVVTPQPSMQTVVRSAALSILARAISGTTVNSAKVLRGVRVLLGVRIRG
jgi:hypothetical protein